MAVPLPDSDANTSDPMTVAFEEARAAEARGEAPIGAAVARNGAVIARAGNRTRELADPTAHAEVLAIREAAATLRSERLVDCDLYVTLEPCAMCAGAISHARIRRLTTAPPTPRAAPSTMGRDFLASRHAITRPKSSAGCARRRRPTAARLLRRAAVSGLPAAGTA